MKRWDWVSFLLYYEICVCYDEYMRRELSGQTFKDRKGRVSVHVCMWE